MLWSANVHGSEYLKRISDEIVQAQRPIRILKAINWDTKVHERFFADRAVLLPRPEYRPLEFDAAEKVKELQALRRRIRGRSEVEQLLRRKCDEFARVVEMLAARGTPRFHELSVEIYGGPRDRYASDRRVDNLEIARLWAARPRAHHEDATVGSAEARSLIEEIVHAAVGPTVKVKESTRLTANAAAGATSIAVKKGAFFTPKQVRALAHHEGLWHVLTSLNGYAQPVLNVLGVGLPRFTESQEGGGILAEFLTGNLTDDRFRELGERTIAVDMAAQGADYLQVFDYLCERFPERKAAQMAERVFRGGVLEGGAPFTKDAVYQKGYCRVWNFLRAAFDHGDTALVTAFFVGKLSVDEAPLVRDLVAEGLLVPPVHLPAWFRDRDTASAAFTHSVTIDLFDHKRILAFWGKQARFEPRTDPSGAVPLTRRFTEDDEET